MTDYTSLQSNTDAGHDECVGGGEGDFCEAEDLAFAELDADRGDIGEGDG